MKLTDEQKESKGPKVEQTELLRDIRDLLAELLGK